MKTINIEKCMGYVWYSDQTTPKVYQNEPLVLTLNEKENPFVVEANFTDGETSYSIRYVDGKYIYHSYNLSAEGKYTEIKVFPQSMPNVYKMLFRRYWKEKEDPLCNDWLVWQPAELVFVKFIEKKENKK